MKLKLLTTSQPQEPQSAQQHRPYGIMKNTMRYVVRVNIPFFLLCFALVVFFVSIILWTRMIFIPDSDEEDTAMYKMRMRIVKNKVPNNFGLFYGPSGIYTNMNIHRNSNSNRRGVLVDDVLDAAGEVVERTGHRIETDICFLENESHLSFCDLASMEKEEEKEEREEREEEEEEEEKLIESVFLVRGGCDLSTLTRDMAQFFAWQQHEEEEYLLSNKHNNNNNNNNSKQDNFNTTPLLFVRTVQGYEMHLPRLTKLIVDVGNRDCDERKQTIYDKRHILHWIRVATGLFQLQPWWDDNDNNNNNNNNNSDITMHAKSDTVNGNNGIPNVNTAVRYVVVKLRESGKQSTTTTTTKAKAVGIENDEKNSLLSLSSSYLLQPLNSLKEFGCVKYIMLASRRSSRWFHSEKVAHRFRLRWIHYMHYIDLQRKQKEEKVKKNKYNYSISAITDTVVSMWGRGPFSPILRRVLIASVSDEVMKGTSANPYYDRHYYHHQHTNSTNIHINTPSENSVAMAVADILIEAPHIEALNPLTITVLASSLGGETFEEDEMMSFLYEKFGEVSRVQLIYLPGSKDSYDMIKNSGTGKKYSLMFVQDYLELLRLLVLTDVLISPHSVALSYAVVMQPGSVVIELFPSDCRSETYMGLANAMHITYTSYEGTSDKGRRKDSSICSILYDNKASVTGLPFSGTTTIIASSSSEVEIPIYVRHSRLSLCDHNYGIITVAQQRLYRLVKNALSSLWLQNSRFFSILAFDRRSLFKCKFSESPPNPSPTLTPQE